MFMGLVWFVGMIAINLPFLFLSSGLFDLLTYLLIAIVFFSSLLLGILLFNVSILERMLICYMCDWN